MQIEIDGIIYDVIIEKKNNKNTYLRVKEDLNIYVTTSYLTPNFAIKKFINDNIPFIRKQIEKMEKRIEKKLDYYYLGEIIQETINEMLMIQSSNLSMVSQNGVIEDIQNKIEKVSKETPKRGRKKKNN